MGVYQASLPGFTAAGGNVQVTAYGSTTDSCKVASWSTSSVNVRCFDTAGNPSDSLWTLRYTDQHVANNGQRGAYAWASDATSASHTPFATYQWHSQGNTLTATHPSVGTYVVTIPNMTSFNKTSATVTAYGGSNLYCNVGGWSTDGGTSTSRCTAVTCARFA